MYEVKIRDNSKMMSEQARGRERKDNTLVEYQMITHQLEILLNKNRTDHRRSRLIILTNTYGLLMSSTCGIT